jgi:hypothetical protein
MYIPRVECCVSLHSTSGHNNFSLGIALFLCKQGRRSLWIWRSMKHEPIVLERNEFRITKAACSCGAELQLAGNLGSVREQFQKLVAAFQKHTREKTTARQKLVQSALPKPTEMTPCEGVNHHPV